MRADAALSPVRPPRPDLDERRKAKARAIRLRRRLLVGGCVGVLALALGIGIGFAGSTDHIPDGVRIAGVDVGGMTAAQARSALERRAAQSATKPATFTAGGRTFTVKPVRLGIATQWNAAIERALDKGDGFILVRGFERLALRFSGTELAPPAKARERALRSEVARIAAAVDRRPRQASVVLHALEPAIVPAKAGLELDRQKAPAVILAALGGFERGAPVALPVHVTQPKVTAADLGPAAAKVRIALSAPVRMKFRKESLTISPKKLSTFLVLPSAGSTEIGVSGPAADRYFQGVAKALDRDPENAGFALRSSGAIRVVPAKDGRALDVKKTEEALLAAALAPRNRTGQLVVATALPRITTEKAKGMGIVAPVGTYTTTYGGDANRVHNVALVAQLIDDHLIAPGEVFSFNKTTGERNADKGFLEAPVIINGELETGIGGGVCQVSTTTFNAAFEAGLSIEERTNHALYISHYPTGRDATVDYPGVDLKFKNDTGHWLWLRTFVGSSSLTVTLYGTPTHRRVDFDTSPLEVTGQPPVQKVDDSSLYVGQTAVESYGEPSRSVSVRRIVYTAGGKKLYDTTFYSKYDAEPKVVHVGTKPRPAPETPATTGAATTGAATTGAETTNADEGTGGATGAETGAGADTTTGAGAGATTTGGDGAAATQGKTGTAPVTTGDATAPAG